MCFCFVRDAVVFLLVVTLLVCVIFALLTVVPLVVCSQRLSLAFS